MTDEGDVDRRLAELEEVLDREAAAARRAVEAHPSESETSGDLVPRDQAPAPARRTTFGTRILQLAGIGVATILGVKIAVPLLLLPVIGALALAWTVAKLALLGGVVYGVWRLVDRRVDTESLDY